MPTTSQAVYKFRRSTPEQYAEWYGTEIGLTAEQSKAGAVYRSRGLIEQTLNALLTPVEEVVEEVAEPLVEEPATVEEIPNSEDFPASLSYDAMTLAELKEECRVRELPVSGTKAELALRLKRNDEGISESTPVSEAPVETAAEEEVDAPTDDVAATEVEIDAKNTNEEPITETDE